MKNCNCQNNNNTCDGSSQAKRYSKFLAPSGVSIDDRSMEELLVFIKDYAAKVRFHDLDEAQSAKEIKDWQSFFTSDMAVILATIRLTDEAKIRKDYHVIREAREESGNIEYLKEAFNYALDLAILINNWYRNAPENSVLRSQIHTIITSNLSQQLQKLIGFDRGFSLIFNPQKLELDYQGLDNDPFWETNYDIIADISLYDGTTPAEKVQNSGMFIDEIFNSFMIEIEGLIKKAAEYLETTLEDDPSHQPHMALFISFLKLFRLVQHQANQIPERILNYYYQDVLQLAGKPPLPDKVYVLFELAKNISEYVLPKNTPLKAGKDAEGKEQTYHTKDDLVINRTKVKEIKTLFIEKENVDVYNQNQEVVHQTIIKNIYARPVANSFDGLGAAFPNEYKAWPSLGEGSDLPAMQAGLCGALQYLFDQQPMPPQAQFGLAIASPQLLLQGGKRFMEIRIYVQPNEDLYEKLNQYFSEDSSIRNVLQLQLSGAQGWVSISERVRESDLGTSSEACQYSCNFLDNVLFLKASIPIVAQPVVAFHPEIHAPHRFNTVHPVVQVLLNPESEQDIPEDLFTHLSFSKISIYTIAGSVTKEVPSFDGLNQLILQNDNQVLENGKAFDPFTASPSRGKSLFIGSEEISNKSLQSIYINIDGIEDNDWRFNAYFLENRQWRQLENGSSLEFNKNDLRKNILKPVIPRTKRLPVNHFEEFNNTLLKGFIRLELANEKYSETSREHLEIKQISITYTSDLISLEYGIDQFFHVYPFGVAEQALFYQDNGDLKEDRLQKPNPREKAIFRGITNINFKLFPQFTFRGLHEDYSKNEETEQKEEKAANETIIQRAAIPVNRDPILRNYPNIVMGLKGLINSKENRINQYSGDIQEEGILFIGLEDCQPLQDISLLFQFAEGSAKDEENAPPSIHWSYLAQNEWHPLPEENILSDETEGFQATGIIKFSLPGNITKDNTIITNGLHWIRASVSEHTERIPRLINIYSQAVLSVFHDQDNSAAHYNDALKPGSIRNLLYPLNEISKVSQPFSSFDGKPTEKGKELYMRISERLRHKQRAVLAWDYEHLVLNRFPSIMKVKCITHTDPACLCRKTGDESVCCGPQTAPGHVLILPVANLKNRNSINPLQPKTSIRMLAEIKKYLTQYVSPFVNIHVKNPVYEQVIVFFRVKFKSGSDTGYYLKKLNNELVTFLSPWAFSEEEDFIFGQKIYASHIIGFIEERNYVDFITDFEMGVCKTACCDEKIRTNTIIEQQTLQNPDGQESAGQPVIVSEDDDDEMEGKGKGSPEDIIAGLQDCCHVEQFLNDNIENSGKIVLTPSSSRSVLVSAPQHLILPYQTPPVTSVCKSPDTGKSSKTAKQKVSEIISIPAGILNEMDLSSNYQIITSNIVSGSKYKTSVKQIEKTEPGPEKEIKKTSIKEPVKKAKEVAAKKEAPLKKATAKEGVVKKVTIAAKTAAKKEGRVKKADTKVVKKSEALKDKEKSDPKEKPKKTSQPTEGNKRKKDKQ